MISPFGASSPGFRKRVGHVTLGLQIGGQEKLLLDFARHADRSAFDLRVLCLSERGPLAAALEELACPVTHLNVGPGLRPGLIWKLARWFATEQIDIVHTHDDKPLLYAAPAVKLARVARWIHSHHHGRLPDATARRERLIGWAGRLTDAFVCVSRDSAKYLQSLSVPRARLRTIWNGIDLRRFPWRGPDPCGPAVIVARLSAEKDHATLLQAAALVAAKTPDFRLDIAGDGPLREELQQQAHALKLNGVVRFLGPVQDISELLGRARVFVLSSKSEGISLTILEAMAGGLPVVATRVGGNPEVVVDQQTGYLVHAGRPQELAAALTALWHDPQRGRSMGTAGRQRVEEYFEIGAMVRSYERLYQGEDPVLGKSRCKKTEVAA